MGQIPRSIERTCISSFLKNTQKSELWYDFVRRLEL